MALNTVPLTDTFDLWRQKTNSIVAQVNTNTSNIGDLDDLDVAGDDLVEAINNLNDQINVVESIAAGGTDVLTMIVALM